MAYALCVAWWSAVCGLAWSMVACLLFEVLGCVVFCQPCEDLVAPSACVGRVLVCVLIRSLDTFDVRLRRREVVIVVAWVIFARTRIGKSLGPIRSCRCTTSTLTTAATAHAEMPAKTLWRFAHVSLLVGSVTRSSLASASASPLIPAEESRGHPTYTRRRSSLSQHGDGRPEEAEKQGALAMVIASRMINNMVPNKPTWGVALGLEVGP